MHAGVPVGERVNTGQIAPVPGEVVNESFMTVMVEVDPAVDAGEHSLEFVRDSRRRIVKNTEIAWHGVDGADLTSPSQRSPNRCRWTACRCAKSKRLDTEHYERDVWTSGHVVLPT